MPRLILECIESWKKNLFGYELIHWNLSNTPIDCDFAKRALSEKKWAFLTDYARLRVLHEQGGIYMDTDVLMLKNFDDYLTYDSFWGKANNGLVEPVIIGAKKNHPLIAQCLEKYLKYPIDKGFQEIPLVIKPVFINIGFKLNHPQTEFQKQDIILGYDFFCPLPFEKADTNDPKKFATKNTIAIHLWNAAWFDPFRFFWNGRKKAGWKAVMHSLLRNPLQSWAFYKNVAYHLKCSIFGYPS